MVKYITLATADINVFNSLKDRSLVCYKQPDSYIEKVVEKPWGYEFLCYENSFIAVWYLFIGKDHSTSMHSHPQKRTSLIVLNGTAIYRTLNDKHILKSSSVINMEPGVFHSTKGMTDLELIEIESPPIKTDLCRLKDNYGREMSGYEDVSKMMCDDHIYFNLDEQTEFAKRRYMVNMYSRLGYWIDDFGICGDYFTFTEEYNRIKYKPGEIIPACSMKDVNFVEEEQYNYITFTFRGRT